MDKVVIFGRGGYYQHKKAEIRKRFEIIGFIDNIVAEGDIAYEENVTVYNPNDIKKYPDVNIILMSEKYLEMYLQLISLGIKEEKIEIGINYSPAKNRVEQEIQKYGKVICCDGKIGFIYSSGEKRIFENELEYKQFVREIMKDEIGVKMISQLPLEPLSRRWGLERGKAVDRYYIEKFLNENKQYIKGDVLEIADREYTMAFGTDVKNSYALHVNGWGDNCIKGNLETGEGIVENSMDCLICTQTLEHIYNCTEVVHNIYRLLRKGGVGLITVAGIKNISFYDYNNWGEFWRFTKQSLERLFTQYFSIENMQARSYGNIKTSIAMLYGICQEELTYDDLEYNDEQYPLIVTIRVIK